MGIVIRHGENGSLGKLHIKKRTVTGWMVWCLSLWPILMSVLTEGLQLPDMVRYTADAIWLCLGILLLIHRRAVLKREAVPFVLLVGTFLVYTLLVYAVRYQSVLYYLWGLRNNFRFYIAFLIFICLADVDEAGRWMKLLDVLFWINCGLSLVQFFVYEYSGDYLGGLFGIEGGTNGFTNILFVIVVSKSLMFYLEKRESTWQCASKCAAALTVAVLAELKFFFVEFILIVVLTVLFANFTWRKFWVIVGGFTAVAVGAAMLAVLFPNFVGWFSVNWLLEAASSEKGYTSTGDINRLNAISTINDLWLDSWADRLFGLGLGNCDTSNFSIVNTPFARIYEDTHYTWLSYAFMYLENGYLGLIFFFGFFILAYVRIRRIESRCEGMAKTWCRIARIMAVCCVVISVYNSSMRTEGAYMAYFVMAIPFACVRSSGKAKAAVAG